MSCSLCRCDEVNTQLLNLQRELRTLITKYREKDLGGCQVLQKLTKITAKLHWPPTLLIVESDEYGDFAITSDVYIVCIREEKGFNFLNTKYLSRAVNHYVPIYREHRDINEWATHAATTYYGIACEIETQRRVDSVGFANETEFPEIAYQMVYACLLYRAHGNQIETERTYKFFMHDDHMKHISKEFLSHVVPLLCNLLQNPQVCKYGGG